MVTSGCACGTDGTAGCGARGVRRIGGPAAGRRARFGGAECTTAPSPMAQGAANDDGEASSVRLVRSGVYGRRRLTPCPNSVPVPRSLCLRRRGAPAGVHRRAARASMRPTGNVRIPETRVTKPRATRTAVGKCEVMERQQTRSSMGIGRGGATRRGNARCRRGPYEAETSRRCGCACLARRGPLVP
jgi:hypothetical protein